MDLKEKASQGSWTGRNLLGVAHSTLVVLVLKLNMLRLRILVQLVFDRARPMKQSKTTCVPPGCANVKRAFVVCLFSCRLNAENVNTSLWSRSTQPRKTKRVWLTRRSLRVVCPAMSAVGGSGQRYTERPKKQNCTWSKSTHSIQNI